jgi:hypothetical protein
MSQTVRVKRRRDGRARGVKVRRVSRPRRRRRR